MQMPAIRKPLKGTFFIGLSVLCCLFMLTRSTAALAADIKTNSVLKAATVYTGRAMLHREAKIELPAGKHTVVFENLPANLYPDSLRVEGQGTATAIFGALSHKIVHKTDYVSQKEEGLNERLEALEQERRAVQADKTGLQVKRNFLQSLEAKATDKTREEIAEFNLNSDKWLSAAETIQTGVAETLKTDLEKDRMIRGIDEKIAKVRAELNQLRTGQKRTLEARLPVEVKKAGTLSVQLSYLIPGATWHPVYDARLDLDSDGLEIVQYGAVTQRTGDDWSDIALTLSTAQPHRGAQAPHLGPMWVNLQARPGRRSRGGGMAERIVSGDSMSLMQTESPALFDNNQFRKAEVEMDVMAPAEQRGAQIDTGGFNAEYIIPGPSSIPADGTESKHLIGAFETDHRLEIHIKPQRNTNAYLVAGTTLKGEAPILAGPVNLFLDGAYVGQGRIPLLRPGKDYDLSFGIDDQIEVAHKTLKDERGESGLVIGKNNTIERRYVTEIQNLRQKPVHIVLSQILPVSKHEDIEIKILPDHTSAGYETDADNIKGLTEWSFALAPQEKKEIRLGWSISWPKDKYLSGLQ